MNIYSKKQNFVISVGIVALFMLFMNIMAYVQIVVVFNLPYTPKSLIVPNLIALVFALILLANRHYYQLSKKRFFYEELAKTDALTGTHNRYACQILFNMQQKSFARTRKNFSLLIFDIDDFKQINDTLGHTVGDRVLKELSQLVIKQLREVDILCRWGGEEFIIILPETDTEGAQVLGKKLLKTINEHNFSIKNKKLTVSMGIYTLLSHKEPLLSAVEKADQALYEAKEAGKNCLRCSQEA